MPLSVFSFFPLKKDALAGAAVMSERPSHLKAPSQAGAKLAIARHIRTHAATAIDRDQPKNLSLTASTPSAS